MLRLTQRFHLIPSDHSKVCCSTTRLSVAWSLFVAWIPSVFDIYIYTISIQITYKDMICITSTICYYLLLKSIIIYSYMKLHGVSKSMEVPLVIIHRWIFHLTIHFFGGYPHMWKPKKYVLKGSWKTCWPYPQLRLWNNPHFWVTL